MKFLAALVIALFASTVPAAQFQNGSFEIGYTLPITLSSGDPRISGWEIGGNGSVIWDEDSIRFPGPSPKEEWIQQTFDTLPGHTYRIIYGLFHQGDGGGPSAIKTDITSATGESLLSRTNLMGNITGTIGFSPVKIDFTATTATTTVRFTHNYSSGATREARIDNVQLFDLSAGATLATALFPGIYIEGQIGLTYELQYSTPDQPSLWHSAGTFQLDQSPKLLLVDTNSVTSQRTYRTVLIP